MRYMIIVKATTDSEAAVMPTDEQLVEMAEYHEQLQRAGVVLDASGEAKEWARRSRCRTVR